MDYEGESDETFEDEKEEECLPSETILSPLRVRSIRIGSYKMYPFNNLRHLYVNLSVKVISFCCLIYETNSYAHINLRRRDITRVLMHFGRDLPLMFIFTTQSFAESVKNFLPGDSECYFDPTSSNEKIQKITFLIDSMTDKQRNFFRHCFPGDKKVKEIDRKEANEILVKSTTNQYIPLFMVKTPAPVETLQMSATSS